MGPKDQLTFGLTLSKAGTAADNVRGTVRWTKPVVKPGPTDSINIAPAPLPAPTP
jgi:hypothetical protein